MKYYLGHLIFVLLTQVSVSFCNFAYSIEDNCRENSSKTSTITNFFSQSLNRIAWTFFKKHPTTETFSTGAKKISPQKWGANEIKPIKHLSKYEGETNPEILSKLINIRAWEGVKYFSKEDAIKFELFFGTDGKLYDANGKLFDTKDAMELDYFGKKRKGSQEKLAIVVMDTEGRIFAHKRPRVGQIHHSSLVNGEDVGFAGEIEVHDGVIKRITNNSGHYFPTEDHLIQFIDRIHFVAPNIKTEFIEKNVLQH